MRWIIAVLRRQCSRRFRQDRRVVYDGDRLTFKDGSTMDTNTVIWAAGVKGTIIPGLDKAVDVRANRYRVNAHNELDGYPDVFALGDVALMSEGKWTMGHPQVAPAAQQQARLLVRNLIRRSEGKSPVAFRYSDKGSMAVIGRGKAVADIGMLHFRGFLAWLAWMFVHVMALVGFRNQFQVLFNWAWKYMSWRNTIRLIIKPYIRRTPQVRP